MATGASTADLAVILVDARKGFLQQTRRHSYIAALLGVKHLIIAVNKMDLVGYSEDRFSEIVVDYRDYSSNLGARSLEFIPMSALAGDNVVEPSASMPWFEGPTLVDYLDSLEIEGLLGGTKFRLPIQLLLHVFL